MDKLTIGDFGVEQVILGFEHNQQQFFIYIDILTGFQLSGHLVLSRTSTSSFGLANQFFL
jgi:hypothetical protein